MAKKEKAGGIREEIEIPEGIEATASGNTVIMKKGSEELRREVGHLISIAKEGNKIVLRAEKTKRPEKKLLGTAAGHIKNMIKGLREGFAYELEMCNVHFPMNVEFDKTRGEIIIKNLLGERFPRVLKVSNRVEVEINAPKIIFKSYDIEAAGQTASGLERLSRVRNRDRNKFQDGIFITKKPRKGYL